MFTMFAIYGLLLLAGSVVAPGGHNNHDHDHGHIKAFQCIDHYCNGEICEVVNKNGTLSSKCVPVDPSHQTMGCTSSLANNAICYCDSENCILGLLASFFVTGIINPQVHTLNCFGKKCHVGEICRLYKANDITRANCFLTIIGSHIHYDCHHDMRNGDECFCKDQHCIDGLKNHIDVYIPPTTHKPTHATTTTHKPTHATTTSQVKQSTTQSSTSSSTAMPTQPPTTQSMSTTASPLCVDIDNRCQLYKDSLCQATHTAFVVANCAKTCNKCAEYLALNSIMPTAKLAQALG